MRLIDGDALRDKLLELASDDWNQMCRTFWANVYNECADMVDDQPSIESQKWIPCSEDSPKSSGEYLVTVKWPSDEYSIDVYEYNVSHKEWNDGESFCGEQAVAWMQLPELYKGGQ